MCLLERPGRGARGSGGGGLYPFEFLPWRGTAAGFLGAGPRKRRDDDIVTASEMAQWAWCPEAWRLELLGHEPENRAAIAKGARHHEGKANFEEYSRSAISVGWWLLGLGLLLAALAFVFLVRA